MNDVNIGNIYKVLLHICPFLYEEHSILYPHCKNLAMFHNDFNIEN